MNLTTSIPQNSAPLTMTSREIAELTDKEHFNVMRDIRDMMDALVMNSTLISCAAETTYIGKDGRQYPQYELDKDTTMCLLTGYDAVMRMKAIKRWQELEESNKQRTENLAFREAYNLTKEEYLFIRQVGKEVAAVSNLINPILDDIEAKVAAMAFNPIAASKLKNDLYNNALARVFRLLKDSEVKQRQLASLDHKAYLAARKDLIDISKYTKEQRLLMQNQAKTRTSVEDVVVADMAKLANIESLLKLQKA